MKKSYTSLSSTLTRFPSFFLFFSFLFVRCRPAQVVFPVLFFCRRRSSSSLVSFIGRSPFGFVDFGYFCFCSHLVDPSPPHRTPSSSSCRFRPPFQSNLLPIFFCFVHSDQLISTSKKWVGENRCNPPPPKKKEQKIKQRRGAARKSTERQKKSTKKS